METMTLKAHMIAGPDGCIADPETGMRRPPVFLRAFDADAGSVSARLVVSAWGLAECEINGTKVGGDVLTPGWTVYGKRLPHWTYDVSDLIRAGRNVMTFWMGDGWYRGKIGFGGGKQDCYGSRLGLFAQLEIAGRDGDTRVIASNADDGLWRAANGPILCSDLYEGETYDARMALPQIEGEAGASVPPDSEEEASGLAVGKIASRWEPVEELPFDPSVLFPAQQATAVRCIGEHDPQSITRLPDGRWLVDFGQNCTQRVVLRIPAVPAGHAITLQHVEVVNPDGTPATRPLRRASQRDRYIASGRESAGEPTWWEPRFTMHGFRYAVIDGWPDGSDLTGADLHARVYSSARRRTGWFSCSNGMLNRLHENARWSMLSNFVSIPTDCPQRDERFGWTGDIAVFAPSAEYLYDVADFLDSWLRDAAIETDIWGTVPYYVPYPYDGWGKPSAVALWGDAVTMVPWALYQATGDAEALRRHIPLARRWMDEVAGLLSEDGVWDARPDTWCGQLGDWLDPTAPPDDAARAMTEKNLVATAFAAHSATLVAAMLRAAGEDTADGGATGADAARYEALAGHIRAGFRARFLRPGGRMTSDTQCAYALAIALDLFDGDPSRDRLRAEAGTRLAELVRERGFVVGTGFAGTPYVLDALADTGQADDAYSLLLTDRSPSWLYQVRMGATTTWERWDSMLPNGEVNPGDMTSFNHYAFGSVADWMHRAIGGLAATRAGWREVRIAPRIAAAVAHGLTRAETSHITPYGKVSVSWSVADGGREAARVAGCGEGDGADRPRPAADLSVAVPEGVTAVLGMDALDERGIALHAGIRLNAGEHRLRVLADR